jgi:LmbE family N-acetylglucosaminyl deacetylase
MIDRIRHLLDRLERIVWSRRAYRFFIRGWLEIGDSRAATQVVNTMRSLQQIAPIELSVPSGQSVLVVAPHPDDEVIGTGGTVIKAIAENSKVHVIYLTSGSAEDSAVREGEAAVVARHIGFSHRFLPWTEGSIPLDDAAVDLFASAVEESGADILLLPFLLDDHDDHRRASELLLQAVRRGVLRARPEIWAYQVYSAVLVNVVVDVTEQKSAKERAIRLYESQMKSRDWANFATGLSAWTSRLLKGRREAAYAEAFLVLPCDEYIAIAEIYFNHGADGTYCHSYRSKN